MKNPAVIFTLVILVAVLAMVWFFTKSPKMSANDAYNSLGNDGIVQRATGKDYPYGRRDPGAGQYDLIDNSINYEKSDLTVPPAWVARRRLMELGSGY